MSVLGEFSASNAVERYAATERTGEDRRHSSC